MEHLLNFFENSTENKKHQTRDVINESDQEKLDYLKQQAEGFLNIQYEVLVGRYKIYCDKIRNCFNAIFPNSPDANLGKLRFFLNKIFFLS